KISEELSGYLAGVVVTVQKEQNGPPVGKPINIEISGDDFEKLLTIADEARTIIDRANIGGVEELQIDLDQDKPEMLVSIDRDRARRLGVSTQQIALALRTGLYGSE